MDGQTFRQSVTDAIHYWEPRRLIYNPVLVLIVVICFAVYYPASRKALSINLALEVFLLAVLANVAYCAAYVADLFAQASGYQEQWRKYRWIVFATGVLFAGIITRFWAIVHFHSE